MKVRTKGTSADRSNLGPRGVAICSVTLGAHEFKYRVIVCKHHLCPVILDLDFDQEFMVGIDWNNQGQIHLHQDHKPLTYSR